MVPTVIIGKSHNLWNKPVEKRDNTPLFVSPSESNREIPSNILIAASTEIAG
jgi:hypothetical protein